MSDLDAVILAGGKGTRLRSVIKDKPKPMAIVSGKPFIEWVLVYLRDQGIKRVILATGYKRDFFRQYFGDGSELGIEILYSEEVEPMGTGGATRKAICLAQTKDVLVLNGDSFCAVNSERMLKTHWEKNADGTIWLIENDKGNRFGRVDISSNDQVLAFREKIDGTSTSLINAGIYIFSCSYMEKFPLGKFISLEMEIFPDLIKNKFFSIRGNGPFLDIGTPESFSESEAFIKTLFFDHNTGGLC
ncbi:MAG: hypothetical protein CMF52_02410 [Legionellales bacterium]|nr:hypothetical protein [Legionellales bacterium]